MRIVIVGAGAVGSYLAERLVGEGHDVVLVESEAPRAKRLQERLDCLVVQGNGASPQVLEEAGIGEADLFIAVTDSDEVNVLACRSATDLGIPTTVARVEDESLHGELEELGVDAVIDPGEACAAELLRLVRRAGTSEVVEFAEGRLLLVGGRVGEDAPVVGRTLAELGEAGTSGDWVVAIIVRDGETHVARGDAVLQPQDHVLVMVRPDHAEEMARLMGFPFRPAGRVIILGSTRVAELTTASFLAEGIDVTVVDPDPDRCESLAARHGKALVVCGDPTDPEVLRDAGAGERDALLALTGWDEVNVLGCLVAKALGTPTAVARFHRVRYVKLLGGVGIDAAVSSRLAAADAILRFVRRGRVLAVATFEDTDAEAVEMEVSPSGEAVGRSLAEVDVPPTAVVGGVLRDGEAVVAHGDTVLEVGHRLIVFALPEAMSYLERFFGT